MTPEELKAAKKGRKKPAVEGDLPKTDLRVIRAEYGIPSTLPTDTESRAKMALALRSAGLKGPQIAEILGTTRGYVYNLLKLAKENQKDTWKEFFDTHAVPRALDNLVSGLENENETYTVRTLESAGVLGKGKVEEAGGGSNRFAFQINVVTPDGHQTQFVEGRIVGQPRIAEQNAGSSADSDDQRGRVSGPDGEADH